MGVSKIKANEDIVNGGCVVFTPNGGTAYEHGSQIIASINNVGGADLVTSRFRDGNWAKDVVLPANVSDDSVSASSSGDAFIVLTATTGLQHVLYGVAWSYSSTPTSGEILIQSPSGTTIFSQHITSAGAGFHEFPQGFRGAESQEMHIVLKDGTTDKKLSLLGHKEL